MKMTRLIPMLPVSSMPRSVDFYTKLGFAVVTRRDEWGWAMLGFGDCRLMVDQSINVHRNAPKQGVVYLYLDDVAAYHEHIRDAGIDVPDPDVTFYDMKEFRIEDPDGNRLWIGQDKSARQS